MPPIIFEESLISNPSYKSEDFHPAPGPVSYQSTYLQFSALSPPKS
jgi:hypothetical protein